MGTTKHSTELTIILAAHSLHQTTRVRYQDALDTLKLKGVAFKDIKAHLVKQCKKDQLWKPVYSPAKQKNVYNTFSQNYKAKVSWAVAIHNFISWVHRNWSNYGIPYTPIKQDETVKKLKKINSAWKTISSLFADTDDVALKASMVQIEKLIKAMAK